MEITRKQRSNANWNSFTLEQKETIEEWLFVSNLSYKTVHRRCAEELGIKWSVTAIWRTRKHLAVTRALKMAASMEKASAELVASGCKAEELRPSLKKMAATRLLEKSIEDDCTKDVAIYGRIVMETEAHDIRREANEIQRERTALAAKKHEFKASQAALKALPLVDEFTKEDEERENERIASVRRMLFGNAPKPQNCG